MAAGSMDQLASNALAAVTTAGPKRNPARACIRNIGMSSPQRDELLAASNISALKNCTTELKIPFRRTSHGSGTKSSVVLRALVVACQNFWLPNSLCREV
eukprot:6189461-Pleurochrysis_carterae.AAC.4